MKKLQEKEIKKILQSRKLLSNYYYITYILNFYYFIITRGESKGCVVGASQRRYFLPALSPYLFHNLFRNPVKFRRNFAPGTCASSQLACRKAFQVCLPQKSCGFLHHRPARLGRPPPRQLCSGRNRQACGLPQACACKPKHV